MSAEHNLRGARESRGKPNYLLRRELGSFRPLIWLYSMPEGWTASCRDRLRVPCGTVHDRLVYSRGGEEWTTRRACSVVVVYSVDVGNWVSSGNPAPELLKTDPGMQAKAAPS